MREKKKFILKGWLIGGIVGALFPIIPFILGYFGGIHPDSTFFWVTVVTPLGIIKSFFGANFVSGPNQNLFLRLITLNIVYFLIGGVIGFVVSRIKKRSSKK